MNLKQAARRLGIHYQTAYKLVRSGRLAAVRIGGTYEISDAALERYVAQRDALRRTPQVRNEISLNEPRDWLASAHAALDATLTDPTPVLEIVVDALAHEVGDCAMVRSAAPLGHTTWRGVTSHALPRRRAIAATVCAQDSFIHDATVAKTAAEAAPVLVSHVAQDSLRARTPAELHQYLDDFGAYSLISAPVIVGSVVVAVLLVTRDAPGRPYTSGDVATVERYAAITGAALERADRVARAWSRRHDLMARMEPILNDPTAGAALAGLLADSAFAELVCDDKGKVLASNERARRFLLPEDTGPGDSLLGRSIVELVSDDRRAQQETLVQRLFSGELAVLDGWWHLGHANEPGGCIAAHYGVVRNRYEEPVALLIVFGMLRSPTAAPVAS